MKELTREQVEFAIGRLIQLIELRGITQTSLEETSGVRQSTISKIENGWRDAGAERYMPSEEVLTKLFKALGHKLSDILNESDRVGDEIFGYLATPLTGLSGAQDQGLRDVVGRIREIAAAPPFVAPSFEIYWPGDHTHPTKHSELPASQVYITDRTRAATHDFILMFCASPSFGVGQENEIATQAGVPAIRLIPERLSRMMRGSFARATDIIFSGTLETGIVFESNSLRDALVDVRKSYFRHCALYRGMNGDSFGDRLRRLIDDRCGTYDNFAADLGISLSYLNSLMGESFAVSNPSIRLLNRMGVLLNERVSYLIGESNENDPIWTDSDAAWRSWIDRNPEIRAGAAMAIRDDWRQEYALNRRSQVVMTTASHRRELTKRMEVKDWDSRYQKFIKSKQKDGTCGQTPGLF